VAVTLGTPFISGKDSLNNEFRPEGADEPVSIPPSLLVSALGQVDDVSRCVTMDLKESGNFLYQVGATKNEMGGSHFALVCGLSGGQVPQVDAELAKRTFAAVHRAIQAGSVRACHDLSEGGLAVAAAEMAFAGGLGARIMLDQVPQVAGNGEAELKPAVLLFSESNTRFLCEVRPDQAEAFQQAMTGVPCAQIGQVTETAKLEILAPAAAVIGQHDHGGTALVVEADLETLREAWQKPLRW
jgi:phosphoribosylformylglycinamidine synthase